MSDGLSVICRVAAGAPDASPEAALLTQSLAALDALPARAPDADVLARVAACAAEASDLNGLSAIRGAMGLGPAQDSHEGAVLAQSVAALATLPVYPPAPETVWAVGAEAEAATFAAVRATAGEGHSPATPEGELLRQSVAALSSLPGYSPSDDAVAAILAMAETASQDSVLAAYDEAGRVDTPEAALLSQSREALDRLPRVAPSEAALAAVLEYAQAATLAPVLAAYGEADAPASAELALLVQSREALDTLPRSAPSGDAVAAVLAAAAVHAPAGAPTAVPASVAPRTRSARRASDRAAAPARRTGAWAGFATLAVAVIAAVVFLQPPTSLAPVESDFADEAMAPPPAIAFAERTAPESEPEAAGGAPPVVAAPEQQILPRRAPRGPSAEDFAPVAERREASSRVPASADLVAEADRELSEAATDWDAGEDLRLLSLRLRQLREQNAGVGWDTPSVAFGASGPNASGTTPGVQAVREGPPAGAIRMRTLPTDTTSRR